MADNVLSQEEHKKLSTIPLSIEDSELVRYFTLQPEDIKLSDPRLKVAYRYDQAAHICLLRWLGWSPAKVDQLPEMADLLIRRQLGIDNNEKIDPPADRTSRLHAECAREHLGWKKYTQEIEDNLQQWLEPFAEEYDFVHVLFDSACRYLYQEKIARPGPDRLERLVEVVRAKIKERLANVISAQLSDTHRKKLDDLLTVPSGETQSILQRFKETPTRASGNELLEVLEKIRTLRDLDLPPLDQNKSNIHPNRVKLLALRAKQRNNWDTGRLIPQQRYLLLVCFLTQALREYTELAVTIYIETIKSIFQRAETKRDKEILERGKSLNDKVIILGHLARLILDENGVPDPDLRQAIYRLFSKDRLANTVHECDEIAQPADFTPMTYAARSYSYLRHFVPAFLNTMRFQSEDKDHPLIEAIQYMREVEAEKHSFDQPPLKFVPWRWKTYVVNEKKEINRQMYEL